MSTRRLASAISALLVLCLVSFVGAQTPERPPGYLTPPPAVVEILDAPPPPEIVVSPTRDRVALLHSRGMRTVAELARPMLRLAGERINPLTSGPHRTPGLTRVTFQALFADHMVTVDVPPEADLLPLGFSADGSHYAYGLVGKETISLWIADPRTGATTQLADRLNAITIGREPVCEWLPDAPALLCRFVPDNRGPAPSAPSVPTGPTIQEAGGRAAPVRTYQDLLQGAHDEELFAHYFTSQLAIVDVQTGGRTPLGAPAIVERASISPDGAFVLVTRLKRPFSYLVPAGDFPKSVEVWNRAGEPVKTLADLPLAESVPIGGVPTGPREHRWHGTEAATVVWIEALDEGDPKRLAPHRDRVMATAAPFTAQPRELLKLEYRFRGLQWTARGLALVNEFDRPTRRTRTSLLEPGHAVRLIWDRSADDRYADPGRPVSLPQPSDLVLQHGTAIYLAGDGSSPEGDRPFLDRLDLSTLETTRLFQAERGTYETVLDVLTDDGKSLLTQYESRVEPPEYSVRIGANQARRTLFRSADAATIRGIEKQVLTYTRGDGVDLSGTLYLPPGYRRGQRLPVLMWAYPREYVDPTVAGQVTGSPHRFTRISGASHLLLLTQGYAIFDNPAMPVIGEGETANDTYVEQLVASAEAAVETLVSMEIADPDRLAIGGHSYGAFMTANLLAHSDLFRAGIARSGAYNRTLTPFGFQNERRTFWDVPEIYGRMSPFFHAPKVNEPILLIHGEADNNSGTFPIQSERFYMALKGHGATVRYVTLPHESHGYVARESVLHVVAEMLNWCDRWVKNAAPRATSSSQAAGGRP